MVDSHQARLDKYCALSNRLAHADSRQLAQWFGDSGPSRGWGTTHIVQVGPSRVFVKRIPLTDLEYDNLFSTKNLYELPTFYNYGVGSAGFGAFRELVTHIKTTNWVLAGAIGNFPLMYHYRIVPFTGERAELDLERHQNYVKYWNSDPHIDHYIRERSRAKYEIILFLEHIPGLLHHWLPKNMDQWETVTRGMWDTLTFLRREGIIHFDAHFGNILVSDSVPYLTDFGLVLDRHFTLDPHERAFFRRHRDYDFAEYFSQLGSHLYWTYRALPSNPRTRLMRRYGIEDAAERAVQLVLLLENLEEIHAEGLMRLDASYVAEVIRHRGLILTMTEFYRRMSGSESKNARYPSARIRAMLQSAGPAGG